MRAPTGPVRFTSGLTIFQEALVNTTWVGQHWTPVGIVEAAASFRGPAVLPPNWRRGDVEWFNRAFSLNLDGQLLHRGWAWEGAEEVPAERPGQRHVCIALRHTTRPVTLKMHTVLDGTAVMTRWLEITNSGDRPAALASVRVWSGLVFPAQADLPRPGEAFRSVHGPYDVGYMSNQHFAHEGDFRWRPMEEGVREIHEDSGKSGWGHPIVYLRDRGAGHIFAAQLAWSGGWTIRLEQRDGLLFLEIGPKAAEPMRVLEPGETISTPPVHIGGTNGELDRMVQEVHEHQRRSVLLTPPEGCADLVEYNHWGYMQHEVSEAGLLREIDVAAAIGAEVFMIDAGWYGDHDVNWMNRTGHWHPGNRLPDGLTPVYDYAHSKGLKCGLWVWIEAATEDSPIIQEHPDWLLQCGERRMNNVLNIAKPEVAAWVESEIVRLIEEHSLDVFRLDYNAFPEVGGSTSHGGFDENTIWRHYEHMYAIWERVRAGFPHLLLENCAAGGGRTDLGMLSRFHYTQMSDHWCLPRNVAIFNGQTMALAPELLNRCVGVCMNADFGGDLEMQLRANLFVGVPGFSGLWPNEESPNPILLAKVRHAVELFKRHVRPMIRTARMFHHTPELPGENPEGWAAFEYAAPDATKAILGIFRLAGKAEAEYRMRPRGLSREDLSPHLRQLRGSMRGEREGVGGGGDRDRVGERDEE